MRDAIVFSTWSWDVFNVPERIALALSMQGFRVLYCEMPVSRFRRRAGSPTEIQSGIYRFCPEYLGGKFSELPLVREWQWRKVARDIQIQSKALGLANPVFLFTHVEHIEPLCKAMKSAGSALVHVCMDYPERYQYELIELSDLTLVIPKTVFTKLRSKYGTKIEWIPQSIHFSQNTGPTDGRPLQVSESSQLGLSELKVVPHPRLGYLGPIHARLNLPLIRDVFEKQQNWHFVYFGDTCPWPLSNVHKMPWMPAQTIPTWISEFDVGLMPYDCFDEKNLHCVPLKLFDYFAAGIPVVSTPVLSLAEYQDLLYFGDTGQQLTQAIESALSEPATCSKRDRRKEVARQHSTQVLGLRLQELLARF